MQRVILLQSDCTSVGLQDAKHVLTSSTMLRYVLRTWSRWPDLLWAEMRALYEVVLSI